MKKAFILESNQQNFIEIKYRDKLKTIEMFIGFVSILSIGNAIAYYELSYKDGLDNANSKYSLLLYACTLLTAILFMTLIFAENIKLERDKKLDKICKGDTIFSTGRYKHIILSFLIIIFHPNPIFEGKSFNLYNKQIKNNIERSINSIMTILILIRFYYVLRWMLYNSLFLDPESKKICRSFNFETNIIYSLKSVIKKSPLKVYFFSLIIFVFIFSYSIRILERSISEYSGYDFNNYWNSIWYVFVTMTTVGYGDFTVKTNEGRIIIMLSGAVGVFLISMMIVAITNILTFCLNEVNAFIIIEKARYSEIKQDSAKRVIYDFSSFVSKHTYRKIAASNPKKLKSLHNSLRHLRRFTDVYQNESTEFILFNDAMKFLDSKQEHILQYKKQQENEIMQIKRRVEILLKKLSHIKDERNNFIRM